MTQKFFTFTKYLLNFLLVLTVGVSALFAAGYFGLINFYQPYIVVSGSMEPHIPTGSVVLSKPKLFGYMQGDVITFQLSKGSTPTTHRISQLQMRDGSLVYQTKGDANSDPDANLVEPHQILGAVEYTIPYIGYAADFAKTPQGFILLVIVPATIVIYEELKNVWKEIIQAIAKLLKLPKSSDSNNSQLNNDDFVLETSPLATKFHFTPTTKSLRPKTYDLRLNFRYVLMPLVAGVFVTIAASAAYFSDTDSSANNVLGAASDYGEQIGQLYLDSTGTSFSCGTGVTDTSTARGFFVAKQSDTTVDMDIKIEGALANQTYDLWINQDPGACPQGLPTQTEAVTTDGAGEAIFSFQTSAFPGAGVLWLSLTSDVEVIRSSTISIN